MVSNDFGNSSCSNRGIFPDDIARNIGKTANSAKTNEEAKLVMENILFFDIYYMNLE